MLFPRETAAPVLAISLPAVSGPDMLFWHDAQDGHYSTKLGYQFVMRIKTGTTLSSSSMGQLTSSFWNGLWSSTALPKCKELSLRAC